MALPLVWFAGVTPEPKSKKTHFTSIPCPPNLKNPTPPRSQGEWSKTLQAPPPAPPPPPMHHAPPVSSSISGTGRARLNNCPTSSSNTRELHFRCEEICYCKGTLTSRCRKRGVEFKGGTKTAITAATAKTVTVASLFLFCRTSKRRARCSPEPSKPP